MVVKKLHIWYFSWNRFSEELGIPDTGGPYVHTFSIDPDSLEVSRKYFPPLPDVSGALLFSRLWFLLEPHSERPACVAVFSLSDYWRLSTVDIQLGQSLKPKSPKVEGVKRLQ